MLFVHGFNSAPVTWKPLRDLLTADPVITAEFDLQEFSYETALAAVPVVHRTPAVDEAGGMLAARLQAELFDGNDTRFIDVTLVGHSMGGLIIQSCLLHLLTPEGSVRTLDRIRQAILFATPNFGSTTLSRVRKALSVFIDNPQERALRLFSDETKAIHQAIQSRVIQATRRTSEQYPIPFFCFWGETDAIVPEVSARGHFPAGAGLPGDHTTLHAPSTRDSAAYRQFTDLLRHPRGHSQVWEVERFAMTVAIAPAPAGSSIVAHHGTRQRTVVYDNVANVRRSVTFSAGNRCTHPFVLKYGTRNGGWVVPNLSGPHITPPDKLRLYDDNGCDAHFEVAPSAGSTSTLRLEVYKGFDQGHRDYHMHLGRSAYYRRVAFGVDLSAYQAAGWRITPPELFFHPSDPGDHALCAQRVHINPDPPVRVDPAGIWTWELEFVTEGVIDLVWDVAAPVAQPAATRIGLQPGEHAVLGYGSLFSVASLERTLGRKYDGPFLPVTVAGWRRGWTVWMPNTTYMYRDGDRWITPPRIFYLNVQPRAASAVTGVLFVVTAEDLKRLDRREWIYDRVDVTQQLQGVEVTGGTAWIYAAKPEYEAAPPASPDQGAIRRTYVDILDRGLAAMGPGFATRYRDSTDPLPRAIVVDDVRNDDLAGT
jgi:pimeloyl-ACP methyl ester carboxylesterase